MDVSGAPAALVKALLLPPASLLLLYAAGALAARRRPRLGRRLCHGAVALLYLLSTGAGAWLLGHPLEVLEPALAGPAPQAQAIVVLSAGRIRHSPEFGNRPVPDFVAHERMAYAATLARRTGLPVLMTGGLLTDHPDEEPLALGMQRVFQDAYRLPVRWTENASTNTAENASLSAAILKRDGVLRMILVTDAMHMRRARRAFEREGMTVTPAPTFYLASRQFDPFDLLPTAEHLRRSCYALYEWLGLLRYHFH